MSYAHTCSDPIENVGARELRRALARHELMTLAVTGHLVTLSGNLPHQRWMGGGHLSQDKARRPDVGVGQQRQHTVHALFNPADKGPARQSACSFLKHCRVVVLLDVDAEDVDHVGFLRSHVMRGAGHSAQAACRSAPSEARALNARAASALVMIW